MFTRGWTDLDLDKDQEATHTRVWWRRPRLFSSFQKSAENGSEEAACAPPGSRGITGWDQFQASFRNFFFQGRGVLSKPSWGMLPHVPVPRSSQERIVYGIGPEMTGFILSSSGTILSVRG